MPAIQLLLGRSGKVSFVQAHPETKQALPCGPQIGLRDPHIDKRVPFSNVPICDTSSSPISSTTVFS